MPISSVNNWCNFAFKNLNKSCAVNLTRIDTAYKLSFRIDCGHWASIKATQMIRENWFAAKRFIGKITKHTQICILTRLLNV